MANSIIDYVFRALGVEYLHRDELAQVPPDRSNALPEPPQGIAVDAGIQLDLTDSAMEAEIDAQVEAAVFVDTDTFIDADEDLPIEGHDAPVPVGATLSPGPGAMANGGTAASAADLQTAAVQAVLADKMGDAPLCDTCGHITVRNGSCYRCLNCGDSKGCS
jgi:ribonucleoside-diphosphate reductase alpha chain